MFLPTSEFEIIQLFDAASLNLTRKLEAPITAALIGEPIEPGSRSPTAAAPVVFAWLLDAKNVLIIGFAVAIGGGMLPLVASALAVCPSAGPGPSYASLSAVIPFVAVLCTMETRSH